jgi:pimeloyl-ACP methyl ester carboxylesterase
VGHSAGALTALFLSEIDPTLVDGLVFVAPALPSRKEYSFQNRATFGTQLRIVLSRAIMSMDEPGLRFVRRMIAKQKNSILENGLGYRPHPATSARYGELDESNLSEEMLLQEAIDGYFLPLKTANWDMGALLNLRSFTIPMQYDYSKVQQPILVALGETDPLTPSGKCLVEILEERSGCVTESIVFANCGHIPMEECPIEFNKALIDFYQSQFRV